MTDDIVAFIRARLDGDEQVAQAAATGWLRVRRDGDEQQLARSGWRSLPIARSSETGLYPETLLHASLHNPRRVLREVEAKRRTLEEHKPMDGVGDLIIGCHTCSWRDDWEDLHVEFPCTTIRLLALPYADHPDYHEQWRPAAA